ncbi:MAG: cyclic nucleotide-binding domain-containing protein [Candidatus Competibacteraceae bacterium]|nr:cyclic nucleotide-binding domain-containing protein [Candidatus Competibacteraceae bacterium]
MNAEAILHNCKLFSRVTEPSRSNLLDMAVLQHFPSGTVIFRQGERCPGLFLVGSGLVRIFALSALGKQQILHQINPGDTFAEVATIGQFACPAFAEAVFDTDCLLLPYNPFQHALRQDHQLCIALLADWRRGCISFLNWSRTLRYVMRQAGSRGLCSMRRISTAIGYYYRD